jgi:demethylmenaquinone methyltransferase/2-methoxy-6-polyprenyl-1,4-benzoquinol methylase
MPMANKYYKTGINRTSAVKELFNNIAASYDLINDIQSFGLHRIWKKKLIKLTKCRLNKSVIDFCCGTGDLSIAAAKTGAKVIGIDISQSMLEIAKARSSKCKFHPPKVAPEFLQTDVLQTPFESDSVDIVLVAYGLRNLAQIDKGVMEAFRLLKPNGVFGSLDFSIPESLLCKWIYFQYLKYIVPQIGKLLSGDKEAYSYILDSLKTFPEPLKLSSMCKEIGFSNVQIKKIFCGTMFIILAYK